MTWSEWTTDAPSPETDMPRTREVPAGNRSLRGLLVYGGVGIVGQSKPATGARNAALPVREKRNFRRHPSFGLPVPVPHGEADTEIPGTRKTARTARPLWGRGLPLSPVKGLQPLDRVAAPDAEAEVVVNGVDDDVLVVADLPADDVLGERGFHV